MTHVTHGTAAETAAFDKPTGVASVPSIFVGASDASPLVAPDLLELYARFFRALGDPTRIRLLQLLLDAPAGERSVGELVEALDAPQSRISTHLGCLRWCGLARARREGKQVYYSVRDQRVRDLLALGGAMIRDHAAGIASCEVVG